VTGRPPAPVRAVARAVDATLEGLVPLSFGAPGIRVRRLLPGWDRSAPVGRGRRVLVTGATSGIGLALVRLLHDAGADVVATARDGERAARLGAALAAEGRPGVATHPLELEDLATVRALAAALADAAPDVIVHNAGAMHPERAVTVDGLERTWQGHVVAPFLLTALLLPALRRRPDARVVLVTSGGMYLEPLVVRRVDSPRGYRPAVAVHAAHPGWVRTPGLARALPGFQRWAGPILRTPEEGADTLRHLALAPRDAAIAAGGGLWHDRRPRSAVRVPRTRTDPAERTRLWERLVADAGVDPEAVSAA
jgi:dehydrogenase/reductase SDR family protein 12